MAYAHQARRELAPMGRRYLLHFGRLYKLPFLLFCRKDLFDEGLGQKLSAS
jgi:hypothetical protein